MPVVLSKEEVLSLLGSTGNIRHKAVMMFLYYAGLRLDEVRNLKWQDLDFDRELVHLKITKGNKHRVLFLHKKIIGVMKIFGIKESGLVFMSDRVRKYSKKTIQQVVKKTSVKAG